MLVSPIVLDPVIESLKLSKGQSTQLARVGVANQIKATVGRDGVLRLDVTANTALEAQVLANAVIDSWLKSTIPGEQDRVDIEQRLTYAMATLAALTTNGDATAGPVIVADLQAIFGRSVEHAENPARLVTPCRQTISYAAN